MKKCVEESNVDVVFTIGKFMKSLHQVLSSNIEKYHFEAAFQNLDFDYLNKELLLL